MIFVSWRLCINIYAWQVIDVNITLHLVRLKMEPIRLLLFVLISPKKSAADAHRIICETWKKCYSH